MKKTYIGIASLSALILLLLVSAYTIYSPEISQSRQQGDKIDETFDSSKKPAAISNADNGLYKVDYLDSEKNYPNSPVIDYLDSKKSNDGVMLKILNDVSSATKLTEGELSVVKQIVKSRLIEDEVIMSQVKLIVADANNAKLISTDPAGLGEEKATKREALLAQVEIEVVKLQKNRQVFEDAITNSLPQSKINALRKAEVNNLTIERNQELSSLSEFVVSRDIGLSDSQTRDISALLERYITAPFDNDIPFGLMFSDISVLRSSPEYVALTQPFATELMAMLKPEQIAAIKKID